MSWRPNPNYEKPEKDKPVSNSQWTKELEHRVFYGRAKETFFNQPVEPKKANLNETGLVEWDNF